MEQKIGKVAYKLQLPQRSRVHPIFHVSQLKKYVGTTTVASTLPVIDAHRAWAKEPVKTVDRRIRHRRNLAKTEVLVEWTNSFPEDAT